MVRITIAIITIITIITTLTIGTTNLLLILVDVQELNLSYYIRQTLLFTLYIYIS